MNVYDSEQIAIRLATLGYQQTSSLETADLVILNTCTVRAKAEQKAFSFLGRLARLKKKKPGLIVGVGGCVAQQEGDKLLDRIPYLDIVIGTHAIPMIPEILQKIEVSGERVCETSFDHDGKYLKALLPEKPLDKVKSYVTIMQGCDHFCSFCIVPYVRGRERSRPSKEILEEIANLSTVSFGLIAEKVRAFCELPKGQTRIPESEALAVRVALIRHFISDQLEFIGVAKRHLTIRAFEKGINRFEGDALRS